MMAPIHLRGERGRLYGPAGLACELRAWRLELYPRGWTLAAQAAGAIPGRFESDGPAYDVVLHGAGDTRRWTGAELVKAGADVVLTWRASAAAGARGGPLPPLSRPYTPARGVSRW